MPGMASIPDPNSTPPSVVEVGSVLISRSIACTRSLLGSVISIDPESSMIASMLVAGVHAADPVAAAAPELPAAPAVPTNTAPARRPASNAVTRPFENGFNFFSP